MQGEQDFTLNKVSPGLVEVGVVCLGGEEPEEGRGVLDQLSSQGEGLTLDQWKQWQEHLDQWQWVFVTHEEDFGRTGAMQHQIPTGHAAPIQEKYQAIPPTLYKELFFRAC